MTTEENKEDAQLDKVLAERYRLKKQLGGGGMGAVYLAHDQETDQTVALKLVASPKAEITPLLQKRMLREIKVLMLAEDPRVISLLDWGRDPTYGLFYTMEHLHGAISLQEHVEARPPDLWESIRLVREVLCGLDALHEIKAIHRDIKPANILCIGDKQAPDIKLIDPGIAKWFPDDLRTQVTVETEAGGFVGTPAYTAPEMWQGIDLDARTDIYQCGIMGYELITGEYPFQGTLYNVMFKHIQEPTPSLIPRANHRWPQLSADILNELDACIKQATAKEPADRFATARDFIAALDAIVALRKKTSRPRSKSDPALAETYMPGHGGTALLGSPTQKPQLPTASELVDAPSQAATPRPPAAKVAPSFPAKPTTTSPAASQLPLVIAIVVVCLGVGIWLTMHVLKGSNTTNATKAPANRASHKGQVSTRPTPSPSKHVTRAPGPRATPDAAPRPSGIRKNVTKRKAPKTSRRKPPRRRPRKRPGLRPPSALDTMLPP